MDTFRTDMFYQNETPEELDARIKAHLKAVLDEGIYDAWIADMIFEHADSKCIIAGYYGDEPLDIFNRRYKEEIRVHISSVVGYSRKLKVIKRKNGLNIQPGAKMKKNIKVAKLFVVSAVFAAIALAIGVVGCNYIGNRNFAENFYSVSSLKADSHIRIIQISDLHNCVYGKDNSKLISRVKKLEPDIIVCTGDILDSARNRQDDVAYLCGKLSEIAPSYYVYGNNEVEKVYDFSLNQNELDKKFGFTNENRDAEKLLEVKDDFEVKLEKSGIKVLKNEIDTVSVGTTNIDIFGVLTSNPSSFWTYSGEKFENYISSNPENLKITAIHEPFIFKDFDADFWGDLILCGHTHGGTVRIPIIGPLYTHEDGLLPERNDAYVYGRYEVSGRPLIVSGGLENTNILRINNQPELVIVDINKF